MYNIIYIYEYIYIYIHILIYIYSYTYRHSARSYLVDGSWDPQIMKTWERMAALIRSEINVSKNSKCTPRGVYLLNQPSSLGCYFSETYPFLLIFKNIGQYLSISFSICRLKPCTFCIALFAALASADWESADGITACAFSAAILTCSAVNRLNWFRTDAWSI